MLLPAALYIAWDVWFTAEGVWSFNENYITGVKYAGLPIEEILFFFVVPYCCVFIYECIRLYFPALQKKSNIDGWWLFLIGLLIIITILSWGRAYTAYTALFLAGGLIIYLVFKKRLRFFNSRLFLVSYAVILIPFLIVNGFLTAIPVVLYNDAENLGTRIYTIPIEDAFYGMLLIFLNILFFEGLRRRKQLSTN